MEDGKMSDDACGREPRAMQASSDIFPSSIFFQSVLSYSIIKYQCHRDQSHGQRAMSSTCMRNVNDTEFGKGAIMKRRSTEESREDCLQAQLIYRRDLDKELVI